ncbi:MAG TPA: diguanylate cyclase [Spirochaetota bacterium]|nr:diguanylate cyclase [Spirochaetota bacterium]HRX49359.1 diguanylate cyclase [Spirochaetota bacterium]
MKLKHYYLILSSVFLAVLIILAITVSRTFSILDKLAASEENRFRSYQLAMELFQTSEDLTRMARGYVVTGYSRYEKLYNEILDIRNGRVPRPNKYTPTYWHLSGAGKGASLEHVEAVPLNFLLRQAGLSGEEYNLLITAQQKADRLIYLESIAFAALNGIYNDKEGRLSVRRAPDRQYAIRIVLGDDYRKLKAEMMEPIQQFIDTLEIRKSKEMNIFQDELRSNIKYSLILIFLVLLAFAGGVLQSVFRILKPIYELQKNVEEIARGNYSIRSDVKTKDEIGSLNSNFNKMAEALESDIQRRKQAMELLRKSEEQVRLMLDSAGEAIFGIDLNGNCTFANPCCATVLGYSHPDEITGLYMHKILNHSYFDGTPIPVEECRIYRALLTGEVIHADDEVFWKADGTSFIAEYRSYPQIVEGRITGLVVSFHDVTERWKFEKILIKDSERLSNILEGSNAGTWQLNVKNGSITINEKLANMLGYRLSELVPATREQKAKLTHPDDVKRCEELAEKHFRKDTESYECEVRMKHKNGNWIWMLEKGQVTKRGEDGEPVIFSGTSIDITSRKLEEEKILHMATHDELTGLPGLKLARDRLNMSISQARRDNSLIAVMFIDLDGFKQVNDTYGHDAGDEVLRVASQRFLSVLRETDTVSRIGGDEFLVILTELHSRENASMIAEKLLHAASEPVYFYDSEASVGASIGISLFPDDGNDMETLIKMADAAMYKVKSEGKNGYIFVTG